MAISRFAFRTQLPALEPKITTLANPYFWRYPQDSDRLFDVALKTIEADSKIHIVINSQ